MGRRKTGIQNDANQSDPDKSKYGPALLLVCLDPENWDITNKELCKKVKEVLIKEFKVTKATAPSTPTIYRLMNHPKFQKQLREHRQTIIARAMPAIEKSLIEKIIDEGDVRAYDRMLRASGESVVDAIAGNMDHISDEELDELIEHFVKEDKKPKEKEKKK